MSKSGIHIKKKNRGKFTDWAKKRGMGVQEAANKVMNNKDEYSSTIVKRANFARNASKWKKQLGGYIHPINSMPYMITINSSTNTLEPKYKGGGYTVTRSDRKGKTHKVTGPDGTVKHFGDPNLKNRPNNPKAKKAWYARHKNSLKNNPHFRAYARKTWQEGGDLNHHAYNYNRFSKISDIKAYDNTEINPSNYSNQSDWLESYIKYPRYNQILANEMLLGSNNPKVKKEIRARLNNINKYPIKEKQVHPKGFSYVRGISVASNNSPDYKKYYTFGQRIQPNKSKLKPGTYVDPVAKYSDPYVGIHELTHSSTQGINQMTPFALNLIDEAVTKGSKVKRGTYDVDSRTGNKFDYQSNPTEIHSRLTEFKKLLYDYGIVDARKEKITRSHIIKALQNKQLRDNHDVKDLEKAIPNIGTMEILLNSIAYNSNNNKTVKVQKGGYANTPYERQMGLLAGKNKFKFPHRKLHPMTMNPMGQSINSPVLYQGFADGNLVDQGIALPGQDFSVYGDEVHEYPMYQQGGYTYSGKGSATQRTYTGKQTGLDRKIKSFGNTLKETYNDLNSPKSNIDYDKLVRESEKRLIEAKHRQFAAETDLMRRFPSDSLSLQLRKKYEPVKTNPVDSNTPYVPEQKINNMKKGGYLKDKNTYVTKDGKETRRGLWSNVWMKRKRKGKWTPKKQEGGTLGYQPLDFKAMYNIGRVTDDTYPTPFNYNSGIDTNLVNERRNNPITIPQAIPSGPQALANRQKQVHDNRIKERAFITANRPVSVSKDPADPYKIQSHDVPWGAFAYNTLRFAEGPDKEKRRMSETSSEYLGGLRNLRHRPNYRPMYKAQNALNRNIRNSSGSVSNMMANMQNATSNLMDKINNMAIDSENRNNQYRSNYLQALGQEGWRRASERGRIDNQNRQNEAMWWQFLGQNAAGYDQLMQQKRTLDNARLQNQMQVTGMNMKADDFRFVTQPDGTVKEYYRDVKTGEFKPVKYTTVG